MRDPNLTKPTGRGVSGGKPTPPATSGSPSDGVPPVAGIRDEEEALTPEVVEPSEGEQGIEVDPSAVSGEAKKRRGRPKGSGKPVKPSKPPSPQIPLNPHMLEQMLFNVHQMLAAYTQIHELAITEHEANQLSTAVAEVAAHYDVTASAKTVAWTNLAVTLATVYGTRCATLYVRNKNSKKGE